MSKLYAVLKDIDVTLVGTLKDTDVVLTGMLRDSWRTITATSPALKYRDYFTMKNIFMIKAHEILAALIKPACISTNFSIQQGDMLAQLAKGISLSDAGMVLQATLEAALVCAIEVSDRFQLDAELSSQCNKAVSPEDICLGIDTLVSAGTYVSLSEIISNFGITASIEDAYLNKQAEIQEAMTLLSDVSAQLIKVTSPSTVNTGIVGAINFIIMKFRKMSDLTNLTMANIYGMTMDELYMITVD